MEASAPGPRRSSHRLTARPYSNAGSAETSISIYLSIGSTFFAISHSPKQMELVTQLPAMLFPGQRASLVSMPSTPFDASSAVRLHSSLSSTHDVITVTPFNHNVHHRGHWTVAAYGCLKPPPTGRLRRAHLHLPHSMTLFASSRHRLSPVSRRTILRIAAFASSVVASIATVLPLSNPAS